MSEILTVSFLTSVLTAAIRAGTPLLFALLGEIIAERGGVLNLGIEGMMVGGALAGFTGAFVFNSIIMGFIFGMIAGAVLALVHGFLSISLKAQQPVSGIMLVLLGIGLTSFLGKPMSGRSIAKIGGFTIPLLNRIPILGPALFKQDILVYLSIALVPVTWFLLHRTRWGLSVIAAGENPGAADTLGINVVRVRYIITDEIAELRYRRAGSASADAALSLYSAHLGVFVPQEGKEANWSSSSTGNPIRERIDFLKLLI